ncbi:hypothetical protein AYI68_g4731, partial [Smittium mucronatum]
MDHEDSRGGGAGAEFDVDFEGDEEDEEEVWAEHGCFDFATGVVEEEFGEEGAHGERQNGEDIERAVVTVGFGFFEVVGVDQIVVNRVDVAVVLEAAAIESAAETVAPEFDPAHPEDERVDVLLNRAHEIMRVPDISEIKNRKFGNELAHFLIADTDRVCECVAVRQPCVVLDTVGTPLVELEVLQ